MSLEGICVDEKATKKRSKNDELPTCFFIPVKIYYKQCTMLGMVSPCAERGVL